MKTLTAMVVDTNMNRIEVKEINDDIHDFYKIIGCECFDIARRQIGGKRYDIICDDIGLWKEDPIITAINPFNMADYLVGNLIIVKSKGPELDSLTSEDIIRIFSHSATYTTEEGGAGRIAVMIGS